MQYLPFIALMTATYVTLTSNLQPNNILFGVMIALLVALLVRPQVRSRSVSQSAHSVVAGLRYIGILIVDLVVSGIEMAQLVLSPTMPIKTGLVSIPTDLGAALSAHAVSLTPGELVVEMDAEHNLYSHALDTVKAAEHVVDSQETRRNLLDQIFP